MPKELKEHENRVALTPRSISTLAKTGNRILVETLAGSKSGFSDDEYISAGAEIARSSFELYSKSELVVKVKEIQIAKGEHERITPRHTIFGFNHFESSRELTEVAIKSKATFISFEKVVDENGQTPLLMPMSRIAGTVSGLWAGFFHNCAFRHDKSIRLKAEADVVKAKFVNQFEQIANANIDNELKRTLSLHDKMVVIFGGGSVGEMAARVCSSLGAKITIIERREARRKFLEELDLLRCSIVGSADREILKSAHVIIGSTYDKEKADRVIDEKMLKEVSEARKKIIIDVAVDQGGNFPFINTAGTFAPSSTGTILTPAQTDYFGNIFIRVPNIPSIVPRYASESLSAMIVGYVIDIATKTWRPELERAVSIKGGKVLDEAIIKAHNLK